MIGIGVIRIEEAKKTGRVFKSIPKEFQEKQNIDNWQRKWKWKKLI